MSADRHERGLAALQKVAGTPDPPALASLRQLAPEMVDWVIDFAYGEVVSRKGLDLRTRELATIAALSAMGNAAPQLAAHIHGGLNVGCEPREVVEVILQMAVYAGFPAAINALEVAKEVFAQRGVEPSE